MVWLWGMNKEEASLVWGLSLGTDVDADVGGCATMGVTNKAWG